MASSTMRPASTWNFVTAFGPDRVAIQRIATSGETIVDLYDGNGVKIAELPGPEIRVDLNSFDATGMWLLSLAIGLAGITLARRPDRPASSLTC